MDVHNMIYDLLDDGQGNVNAAVDGSVTPVQFAFRPAIDGRKVQLSRLFIWIRDNGNFSPFEYGNLPELTNGVRPGLWNVSDDTIAHNLISNETLDVGIKSNGGWALTCYDITFHLTGGGDGLMGGRWSFDRDDPQGHGLVFDPEDHYFAVEIRDDLTGMSDHAFALRGRYIP